MKKVLLYSTSLIVVSMFLLCTACCKQVVFAEDNSETIYGKFVNNNICAATLTYSNFNTSPNYKTNVKVSVNCKNKKYEIVPPIISGYSPQIKAFNFLNNNLEQIVIILPTGGSGGYTNFFVYSYSPKTNNFELIFRTDEYAPKITAEVKNNVATISHEPFKPLSINNANILSSNVEVMPVNYVLPVYNAGLNKYLLATTFKIVSSYQANQIGNAVIVLELGEKENKEIAFSVSVN